MIRRGYILIACAMAFLTSCSHKELCIDHHLHTARVEYLFNLSYEKEWEYNEEGHVDWKQNWDEKFGADYNSIRPNDPEGVCIRIYYDDNISHSERNVESEGGKVFFDEEGKYSVLLHNNDTEYIVYKDMNSYSTAYATTRGVLRSSYMGTSFKSENEEESTVNSPDMLYGAYFDQFDAVKSTSATEMNVTLRPLVFTYVVRYEISKGAEYVALARGALAGMARGVNLGDGRTSVESATVMFDASLVDGGAQAYVKSFGIPDYPNPNYTRTEGKFGLNFEVKLKDGSTQQFEFDVTEQVAQQPHGGVIVVSGIEIEEPKASEDEYQGSFDIGVNGWGDAIDIPLIV